VRIVAVTFYTTDPDIHSRVERGLVSLELDHLALALLLSSQLEVLGSLDGNLVLPLAGSALHPEDELLCGLGFLPQDGLGLTTEALLLAVVPPPALGLLRLGGLLVLGHLELAVLVALGTVRVARLGNVNHPESRFFSTIS